MKLAHNKIIFLIFVFSLAVRLFMLAILPSLPLDESAHIYLMAADLLLDGEGFKDTSFPVYNPPLYPILIAAGLSLFGDDLASVKVVQVFVDSLTIVLVYFILREIFDIQTGLLAAGILSCYPFSIYLAISIASEPFFTFFLNAFVLFSLYAIRSDKPWCYAMSGVLLGLTTLMRATTQFVPLLFIAILVLFKKRHKEAFFGYTAFCLSFVLVLLPWTMRNYLVINDFIPVATGGGIVVLMGSSEKFLTIDGKPEMYRAHSAPSWMKPSQRDRFITKAGLERHKIHLQTDPFGFLAFMAKKFVRLWYATESGSNHAIILLGQAPIYILAAAGLVSAVRRVKLLAWIPFSVIAYFAALHWLSLPLFRYMIPIMPYVIGFGAFAITSLMNRGKQPDNVAAVM